MRSAETILIFPNTRPVSPKRDDKHMRLLGSEGRHKLLQLLGNRRNWYYGFYTIGEPTDQPTNIGFVFRSGTDELVLFFDYMTIQGTFRGNQVARMLEEGARNKLEAWKRRYAQRELAAK
jgi:hypothetical protein